MKQIAIVVDIDNTLVDTAQRKQSILAEMLDHPPTVDEVRKDFHLIDLLGGTNSAAYRQFFEKLSSPDGIRLHKAPGFAGAADTLMALSGMGYKIILLTARPIHLLEATKEELEENGLLPQSYEMYMAPLKGDPSQSPAGGIFKTNVLDSLSKKYEIVAVVADRPQTLRQHPPTPFLQSFS